MSGVIALPYKMKSPWRDGTTHVSFSPLDFIARLVALIPPPRVNMVRYSGCFVPNFKDRKFIVKKNPKVNRAQQIFASTAFRKRLNKKDCYGLRCSKEFLMLI